MKHLSCIVLCLLIGGLSRGAQIEVTFRNGAVRTLTEFTVANNRLLLPAEQLRVDLAQVASVEFLFDGPPEEQPDGRMKQGRGDRVAEKLNPLADSLVAAVNLPGNSARLLGLLYKARFHQGDSDGMRALLDVLRRVDSPYAGDAAPYEIITWIDEGRIDEAARRFEQEDNLPAAARLFIEARLAVADGDIGTALRILARLQAFHFREAEWMPAALAEEARLRQGTGKRVAAGFAAREARFFYPHSRAAQQLDEMMELMDE